MFARLFVQDWCICGWRPSACWFMIPSPAYNGNHTQISLSCAGFLYRHPACVPAIYNTCCKGRALSRVTCVPNVYRWYWCDVQACREGQPRGFYLKSNSHGAVECRLFLSQEVVDASTVLILFQSYCPNTNDNVPPVMKPPPPNALYKTKTAVSAVFSFFSKHTAIKHTIRESIAVCGKRQEAGEELLESGCLWAREVETTTCEHVSQHSPPIVWQQTFCAGAYHHKLADDQRL